MTDLVERVALAIKTSMAPTATAFEAFTPEGNRMMEAAARAAIVAVLDDLMEPTEAMYEARMQTIGLYRNVTPEEADKMFAREEMQSMLTAKRAELSLDAPAEPGEPTQPPAAASSLEPPVSEDFEK